jgi:DNA topoisomerase-1
MLGEANEGGGGGGGSGTSCAPVAVAGGGRLMGQHQGQDVVIKSGKYGAYVVWGSTNISLKPLLGGGGNVPSVPAPGAGKCSKYTPKSKTTTNQKSEFDLTLEDVVKFIDRNSAPVVVEDGDGEPSASAPASKAAYVQGQILRTIDENTTIRYGRYGPYIFHKTAKMSKPAFVALKGFPEKHGNYMSCDAAVIREWVDKEQAGPAKQKPKFGFFKKK